MHTEPITTRHVLGLLLGILSTFVPNGSVTDVSAGERPQGLVAGTKKINRDESALHGPSEVKLVRVWQYDAKQSSPDWLKQHYGAKSVLDLRVEGTPYSLLIVNGKVTPLILVSGPWEIWRIEGLGKSLKHVALVKPAGKRIELTAPGGDVRSIWAYDFSRGFTISYREEYDGF